MGGGVVKETNSPVPFGLLFEEPAAQPQNLVMPVYDEETDLSYVEDPAGRLVPCVELTGVLGTQTNVTKIWTDPPDTDPEDDRQGFVHLGTMTLTKVRNESTDTDPEDDRSYFSNLGTRTLTEVQVESTDTDPEDDRSRL